MNTTKQKELDNKTREILGKAYIQAGEFEKGINLLKKNKVNLNDYYITSAEQIIKNLKKGIRINNFNSIFAEELNEALIFWIKGGGETHSFVKKIINDFPGTAYNIMHKKIPNNEHTIEFEEDKKYILEKKIKYTFEKKIIAATEEKDKFPLQQIEDIVKSDKNLNSLLLKVAKAYIKIGFISEGINIYHQQKKNPPKEVIQEVAMEYSDRIDIVTECYLFLEDHEKLELILLKLIEEEKEQKKVWQVAKKLAEIESK